MKVELLHIADCPNTEAARRLLKKALREVGLPKEISEIEVSNNTQAEALAFPGSPTIRVDGKDVETTSFLPGVHGLACRTYMIDGTRHGVPSLEIIRIAIRSAISVPSSARARVEMPPR